MATGEWARGEFVFLYPRDNARCETVVTRYAECLRDASTFDAWTLEQVVSAGRVAPGDHSPRAPTDPDVRISRIRLLKRLVSLLDRRCAPREVAVGDSASREA